MNYGFFRAASASLNLKVADPQYNKNSIINAIEAAEKEGARLLVTPELSVTGYTCADLFFTFALQNAANDALAQITATTKGKNIAVLLGMPVPFLGSLYNCAVLVRSGKIIGAVPKKHIANYNEFYEKRWFASGFDFETVQDISICGFDVKIGDQIFDLGGGAMLGVELCEDLWTPEPPSIRHARNGATLLVNLSASDETTGKDIYRRELVNGQSARLLCGYIYASAGDGESTQDVVYSGHNVIAENGHILKESERFGSGVICTEIDVKRIEAERRRMTTFEMAEDGYVEVRFSLETEETALTRFIDPMPFVPGNEADRIRRCDEILAIQAAGLKKRLEHTHCKTAVVGISGGLDSTLALLVTVRAFDLLGIPHDRIKAVTMPGFGTTDRTYDNAVSLIRCLGADFTEVDIKEAVNVHFRDIGQDPAVHDVTYENGQARERTQILMDIANKEGGMVIGTGDLSELALGWATYNGDHMSMYAVNASVPKTLVRHLVRYYADTCGDEKLGAVLTDVLDTPVSPELLPPEDGKISQKTEDLVGPYELHDFYLYHMLRLGFAPKKVYRLAKVAFDGVYDDETILKWLKTFYRRFFAQQFKRSCLPDGPKVGSVAVSPRGDLRMPSDACAAVWLQQLEEIG